MCAMHKLSSFLVSAPCRATAAVTISIMRQMNKNPVPLMLAQAST